MTTDVDEPARQLHVQSEPKPGASTYAAAVVIGLKALLLVAMLNVSLDPGWANLDGKAPAARVVLYPLWAFSLPLWWVVSRRRGAYPWVADLLVTSTCFADVAGNRLDLYDEVVWFDDWMHLANAALVSAAVVVLAVPRSSPPPVVVAVAVAAGMTASLAWELFEYGSFLTRSTEWTSAYTDTIGDLSLGWLGSVAISLAIARAWRRYRSIETRPRTHSARPY